MTRFGLGTTTAFLILVAAAVLPAAPTTAAAPGGGKALGSAATTTPLPPQFAVTLPTGDQVVVRQNPGGPPAILVKPRAADSDPATTVITAGADTYVIPHSVAAKVGRGLDLSRFDVTRPSSATPHQDGLLTKPPQGQLFTVTVHGLDRNGGKDEGDLGVLTNVDNTARFIAGQSFYHGSFAFSVPRGHYSVQSYISTVGQGTPSYTLVTNPQFLVNRDLTITLDARDGVPFTTSTPRPSTPVHAELNLQRMPATGEPFTDSLTTFGGDDLFATPTQPVTVGKLYFYPAMRLGDASGSLTKYLYDVDFPSVGVVPADLDYTVTAADLATVHARYASVVPNRNEEESRQGYLPWETVQVGSINDLTAPLQRLEYVTARPHLVWRQEVDLDPADGEGRLLAPSVIYQGGQRDTIDWATQPMGSGVEQEKSVGQPCPVCRSGDTLSVAVFPHVDVHNNIMLAGSSSTENLTLYQDGTSVGSSRGGFATFPMSPDPASYRLQYDVDTSAAWFPTSTHVSTSWDFDSAERAPDHLPPGWTCGGKLANTLAGRPAAKSTCSFEHLLLPHYATSAGLDGVIAAGTVAHVIVSVTPQRGLGADPLSTLTAQVSYDGGTTWREVTATRESDTSYQLTYKQPKLALTDGFASLAISATSTSGAAVSQTTLHAYPLAPLTSLEAAAGSAPAGQPGCAAPVRAPLTQCLALVNLAAGQSRTDPVGYGPADLRSAYRLLKKPTSDAVVAVVTPYDDPNAETDLEAYRSQFGLPACSGCLTKVNQNGQASPLPPGDPGWGVQTSLALDAVSAVCPSCKILLVEADTSSLADLVPAALTAARLHADVISNGYGTVGEFSGEQRFEHSYASIDVPFVVASADYGYGNGVPLVGSISYPSASRYAVAVGGTTLTRSANSRGFSETAWAFTTSGCSAYIAKPRWQHDALCAKRATADVAAVGDPATGLAVYDTYGSGGWQEVGGTSAATAVISGIYGLNGRARTSPAAMRLYRAGAPLFDITSGANGHCHHTYLCTAVTGYDGPSGIGTPRGAKAF